LKNRKYETLLCARPEYEKDQLKELVTRLSERIERNQGKLVEVVDWGLRKLAYPIRLRGEKFFYGRYLLLVYAGNGKVVKELEDYMKLIEDTFRFNTYVVSEEVPALEQAEPIWREEVIPEVRLRDDGEGLEVIEASRTRKLSKDEMYRPKLAQKAPEEGVPAAPAAPGAEAPAAEGVAPAAPAAPEAPAAPAAEPVAEKAEEKSGGANEELKSEEK
jgi:small subunit ribosomal protein S6